MDNTNQHIEALQDIRQMMKQSSRFLSLSGLAGVFAGIYALGGAWFAYRSIYGSASGNSRSYEEVVGECVLTGVVVLVLSICTALYFSGRKARRNGQKLVDHTALRMAGNFAVPLATGGILCIALIQNEDLASLTAPVMLIFYGLALFIGSKYTLHDVRYLGCAEIALGLLASFHLPNGLIYWAIGFGLLHILYGSYMWFKYDRIVSK